MHSGPSDGTGVIDRGTSRRFVISALRRGFFGLLLQERTSTCLIFHARSLVDGQAKRLLVVRQEVAANGVLGERLAREALAATHLLHPNLTRVGDLIPIDATWMIVVEQRAGRSPTEILDSGRRLDPKDAAVAVLQAARGVKYAHDRGLYHRYLTPSSLMVQPDGLVKIVGFGCVLDREQLTALASREAEFAGAGEAAKDRSAGSRSGGLPNAHNSIPLAANEWSAALEQDRLTDIASLGRTLATLVSGREDSHSTRLVVPRNRMPARLQAIVDHMTGVDPADRWRDLGPAIEELERFLDLRTREPLVLPVEIGEAIARGSAMFASPPSGRLRNHVRYGFAAAVALIAFASLLAGRDALAIGLAAFGMITWAGMASIGEKRGAAVSRWSRLRGVMVERFLIDPILGVVSLALLALLAWALGVLGIVLTLGLASILLVLAYRTTVGARFAAERRAIAAASTEVLKELRLKGHAEPAIRRFAWSQGGFQRPGEFEELFGFRPEGDARVWLPLTPGRFADQIFARCLKTLDFGLASLHRRLTIDRRRSLFRSLEERRACSLGVYSLTARRKAIRIAESLIEVDGEFHALSNAKSTGTTTDVSAALREAVLDPESVLLDRELGLKVGESGSRLDSVLDMLLGSRARFLIGAGLMAGCLVWIHQNNLVPHEQLGSILTKATEVRDLDAARGLAAEATRLDITTARETSPLELPALPRSVSLRIGTSGAGVAGLILLLSAPIRGWRSGLGLVAAASLAILGPELGIPSLGGIDSQAVAMLAAFAGWLAVMLWNRRP